MPKPGHVPIHPPSTIPDYAPVEPKEYSRIFESDHGGAAILEELTRLFAKPAVLEGGIDAVLKTYDRNGSRKVLEFIMAKCNATRGVPASDD